MNTSNKEQSINKTEENIEESKEQLTKQTDKDQTRDINFEDKLKETEEKLLRSLAEIETQRRRSEKEIKDASEFGSFNFAKDNLAILDNLQRAKEAIRNDEKLKNNTDLDKFLENITIIEKDLISIFEKNRIKKIDVENEKFDPNFHQAMSEVEDENKDPGTILQEIQAGYMLGERLLRPALVSVSKKNSSIDRENRDKKEEK